MLLKKKNILNDDETRLDLSPLLDMVFILLIFFVVTTTFTRETGVEVKKPKASSATEVKQKIVKVAITREGTIHVFEKQVNLDELENVLSREYAKNPKTKLVVVADKLSITESLVNVIDRANIAGITDTSVASVNE